MPWKIRRNSRVLSAKNYDRRYHFHRIRLKWLSARLQFLSETLFQRQWQLEVAKTNVLLTAEISRSCNAARAFSNDKADLANKLVQGRHRSRARFKYFSRDSRNPEDARRMTSWKSARLDGQKRTDLERVRRSLHRRACDSYGHVRVLSSTK